MNKGHHQNGVVSDLTRGALAGLVATWTMDQVTGYLYEQESQEALEAEQEARGGKTAYGVAAEKAATLTGTTLSDKQRQAMGQQIHWALGIGAGAAYGVLRRRCPGADWGEGTAFGTAFFLLVDEITNPALDLTPGPQAFPWQTHARGIAGHLAYGLVADQLLSLME